MREVQEIEAGGTEGRKEVELPNFSKRQLSTFEAVFFTEEQVKKCEEIFNAHLKSSSPIYLAWKALKVASLPTEEEVVEEVLARLEICQKIYRTEDFRVKNLHRKRVIFDIC